MRASSPILLATRDASFASGVAAALAREGFDVSVVGTNLELVWRVAAAERAGRDVNVVVDTRAGSCGTEPLHWLRSDRAACALLTIAAADDDHAIAAAELADAAGVVTVSHDPPRARAVAREICRILRGRPLGELFRWTLPRAARLRRRTTPQLLLA